MDILIGILAGLFQGQGFLGAIIHTIIGFIILTVVGWVIIWIVMGIGTLYVKLTNKN